jgi:hypothetical protein
LGDLWPDLEDNTFKRLLLSTELEEDVGREGPCHGEQVEEADLHRSRSTWELEPDISCPASGWAEAQPTTGLAKEREGIEGDGQRERGLGGGTWPEN